MSIQEFDLIQRIRVEKGVPSLVSTVIKVIEGGQDLLSLAIEILKQRGFYDGYEENRTSQYIGYRLKNASKGEKRYQLILSQRKEGLCISIPQGILKREILHLGIQFDDAYGGIGWESVAKIWVIPYKEGEFLESFHKSYGDLAMNQLDGNVRRSFTLYPYEYEIDDRGNTDIDYGSGDFNLKDLGDAKNYILFDENKLFPYTWQACLSSTDELTELLNYFLPKIMER